MNLQLLVPLFCYMLFLFFLGFFSRSMFRAKEDFNQEYFIGGRVFGGLLIAFTLSASLITSATVLSAAEVSYMSGLNWIYIACGQIAMGWMILGGLGKKYAIVARRINAVTVVDFIRYRYESKPLVILVSVGILVFMGVYMVAQLVGGARIMEAATGLNYQLGLIIFAFVILFYTIVGGFKAVVYADFIQGSVILIGGISIFLIALNLVGGFQGLTIGLLEINPDLATLPGVNKMGTYSWAISLSSLTVAMVVMPHAAVRCMAYKDSKAMHRAIMITTIVTAIITFCFGMLGPIARVLIPNLEVAVLAVPVLTIEVLPPVLAGIILGAPIAAIISSVDSMLLIIASSIIKDLYNNYLNPGASATRLKRMTFIVMVIVGLIMVLIASNPPEVLQFLVLFSTGGMGTVLATPLLFGLYWKQANSAGCFASIIGGIISYGVFGLMGGNYHPYGPAFLISIFLMITVSHYTARPSIDVIRVFWGKMPAPELQDLS